MTETPLYWLAWLILLAANAACLYGCYVLYKWLKTYSSQQEESSHHNLWRKTTIDEESFKSLCIHLLLVRKQNKFGDYLREGHILGNIQHSFTSEHTYEFIGTNGSLEAYFEIGDEIEVIFVDELSAR
jgi:hypothetical protein